LANILDEEDMAGRRTTQHGLYRFDPVIVGHRECEAWAAYYRREWVRFLVHTCGMVQAAFGMRRSWTLRGAWYVLRANLAWAPVANDPAAARDFMRRFYELVVRSGQLRFAAARAADLEVSWWAVHRWHQHAAGTPNTELVDSLNELYAYVYQSPPEATRMAAEIRVAAMDLSDRWVAGGAVRADPLLVLERRALVDSYTELRRFVDA
jgi:hypothetical protein